jgi:hypothetical protein
LDSTVKKFIVMLFMAAFLFSTVVGCEGEKKKEDKKADTTKKDDKKP